jgi:hypothetical protein
MSISTTIRFMIMVPGQLMVYIYNGFNGLIENNIIDGAYGVGIVQVSEYSQGPEGSGFVLTVKGNIIKNTRDCVSISNKLLNTHFFQLQCNCLFRNVKRDYENVETSSKDIKSDPQFLDRSTQDYHLN